MRGSPLVPLVSAALVLLCTPPLAAQTAPRDPPRPRLDARADTNDADAYFTYVRLHRLSSDDALAYFHWAYRLDPSVTAYRLAEYEMLEDRQPVQWWIEYWNGTGFVVHSKEAKRLDSLYYDIIVRDPYVHLYANQCTMYEGMEELDLELQGDLLYGNGCLQRAADVWGRALAKNPGRLELHRARADAFYFVNRFDSAASELRILLDSLRTRDQKQLVHVYDTKEIFEYKLGTAYERMDDYHAAREAYGRSLAENLSFYMSHVRLGAIAAMQGDLKTAATEYDLAAQLKPDDPIIREKYAVVLIHLRRYDDAATQLRAALDSDPYYHNLYYDLAAALDAGGHKAEALKEYQAFMLRVPGVEMKLKRLATGRINALTGELSAAGGGAKASGDSSSSGSGHGPAARTG